MKKLSFIIMSVVAVMIIFTTFTGYADLKEDLEVSSGNTLSLPTVTSYRHLKMLVEDSMSSNQRIYGAVNGGAMEKGAVNAPTSSADTSASSQTDYSRTNVQVEGVDESDIVKTDGNYIYEVSNQSITIVKAYPAKDMEVESIIRFDGTDFNPSGLYVDGSYLTVIGQRYSSKQYELKGGQKTPYYYGTNFVKVLVYDITDSSNPKKIREAEIQGSLLSSRKIGSKLYIVCNSYIDYYLLEQGVQDLAPTYRDSSGSGEYKQISLKDVKYFPDSVCDNFMIIGAMDLTGGEISISTYLGAGQNIYASNNNLYVAVTKFQHPGKVNSLNGTQIKTLAPISIAQDTLVYKFSLKDKVDCIAKGEVPGRILNQFSMDEYDNHFRIATTTGDTWMTGDNTSKNNIYVLDENLSVSGKIENIAPGEKIYSVRFMGGRGYVVTFKTVDPLFVIDFKDYENPKILGALKIPGFSDYLHPYDENHIIGFGKDTIEIPVKDDKGNVISTRAFYLGMKVAIFDVTDVNNPVEMFTEKIGDRGTSSDLLNDHKALLFSKEKNLLAFPVSLFELKEGQGAVNNQNQYPEYGIFKYQGAYIYNIDLEKGFTLRGRISHISEDEYAKLGNGWYGGDQNVERIIYINNTLYTISRGMVKASDMDTLNEISSVSISKDVK